MNDGDLRELYQEVVLDHGRHPRRRGRLEGPVRSARGNNPLCGDRFTVYVDERDGRLERLRFDGKGCAISTASASLMAETLEGRSEAEARELAGKFRAMVTGAGDPDPALGKLVALAGVREFPVRVKCATLPWHTLLAALEGRNGEVTTEGGDEEKEPR